MGMEEPDHLAEPAFAERIWRTSGGVTGNFKRILHWSGKVARRHDRRFVTQDDITEALQLFRSEEHTSELQSLMRISYAVFCLKKKKNETNNLETSLHMITTQSINTNKKY